MTLSLLATSPPVRRFLDRRTAMTVRDDERDEENWGVAPPYGAYRGHYGDYTTAQMRSLGSGRLGGWSAVSLGGSFDESAPDLPSPELDDEDEEQAPEEVVTLEG
jgi:hypothetical protein